MAKDPADRGEGLSIWLVTVDMGLGHQRATHPLAHLAKDRRITVGKDSTSSVDEQKL